MNILLIDMDQQIVVIFDEEGIKEVDFTDVESLDKVAMGDSIYYVTSAMEAKISDIKTLVRKVAQQHQKEIDENPSGYNIYLVNNKNGVLHFPEETRTMDKSQPPPPGITFQHFGAYKLIDEEMDKKIKSSMQLRAAIQAGLLKKMTEPQLQNFLKRKKERDQRIERIKMKKVAKYQQKDTQLSAREMAQGIGGDEMDITSEISRRDKGLSEVMQGAPGTDLDVRSIQR